MAMGFLAVGTVLAIVFGILLICGRKYDYMFEALDGDNFPLKSVYGAGMFLQDMKIGKMPEKLAARLHESTRLIYSRKYSEYYTRIIWAQSLSLGLLFSTLFFILAGVVPDMAAILGVVGVVMAILPGAYFINHAGEQVSKRRDECDAAFPNAISKLALIVNSGVILHDAWEIVAYGNDGTFYDMMRQSCDTMKNGKSDIDAITEFGYLTDSEDIKKFTSALTQSIERGGAELPSFLSNQSRELWNHHRQYMLQKGEKAAGALLMPITLMFVGIIMIVIAAAMQSLF